MLFPHAQSNLRELMKHAEFDASNKPDSLWLLGQFNGLAGAVKHIYDLSTAEDAPISSPTLAAPSNPLRKGGWHHDLKPENILFFWSPDPPHGSLRIPDWGAGKVNTYRSGSVNTDGPIGSPTYEPPEATYDGNTSRPYDVWSLGCVFLEILVWAVFDFDTVQKFANDRLSSLKTGSLTGKREDDAYWKRIGAEKYVLRESVNDQIQSLETLFTRPGHPPFKEVLELVKEMLETRRDKRITALLLRDRITKIHKQKRLELTNGRVGSGLVSLISASSHFQQPTDAERSPIRAHLKDTYVEMTSSPTETRFSRQNSYQSSLEEPAAANSPRSPVNPNSGSNMLGRSGT